MNVQNAASSLREDYSIVTLPDLEMVIPQAYSIRNTSLPFLLTNEEISG
jgi:hypothetical protein